MMRSKRSFAAHNSRGEEVLLEEFQEEISVESRKNPGATGPGIREVRTRAGDSVNRLAKGKYEVVQTGEVLESDDPDAP